MKDSYSVIGSYLDLDGIAFTRFNLEGNKFTVLRAIVLDELPSYESIYSSLFELASMGNGKGEIVTLCNFGDSLKAYLVSRFNQGNMFFRVRSTEVNNESPVLLQCLLNEQRLILPEDSAREIRECLDLWKSDKDKEKKHHLVYSLLHSVSFSESRLIAESIFSSSSDHVGMLKVLK
ncbi:MAG: hypothetical protein KME15_27710 [Drouetiella hepatica Uher 2000/2452]|jgi:hypothetical protein|uniref:Uncharacterized protein n=1 Tax=Drouetiella hepatica Uher 2000/2452 TaxID=904376 RepID=A0A951UPZ0_9CYAN|nr:hypothetical protein [Drouetiella hepatica Uher 2000/2452]